MSMRDAFRTSILSQNWRDYCLNIPKLKFDDEVFQGAALKDLSINCKLLHVIYPILLLHKGPILKFSLCHSQLSSCREIDQIILHLSRNATVKKFTLSIGVGDEKHFMGCWNSDFAALECLPIIECLHLSSYPFKTSMCLLKHIRKEENCKVFTGRSGEELLILAISSKNWNFASELLERYETIHSEAVLMAMSQNYPRRCNFQNGLKEYLEYEGTELDKAWEEMFHSSAWSRHTCAAYLWKLSIFGYIMIRGVSLFLFLKAALSFMGKRYMNRADARSVTNPNTYHHYYNNTIFEATRQNASDVVQSVVSRFADAIWCTNEDGHNFIQYAVINRSENVYSLVYKMSEHMNIYKTIKDSFGNNLLHLAARLAPANRLNNISGAALQLQPTVPQYIKPLSSPNEITAAINHLRSSDPLLANLIDNLPPPVFDSHKPPFLALTKSILFQQLANKAGMSIYTRFVGLCGGEEGVGPETVLALNTQQLKQIGVSGRKASYLYDLANKYRNGILCDESVVKMDDRSLFTMLSMVKGIGSWSVHMFMIFSLHRPDVLPVSDLGVRKGVQLLYGLDELPRPSQMEQLCEKWRPYRSVGAWYMWRFVEGKGASAGNGDLHEEGWGLDCFVCDLLSQELSFFNKKIHNCCRLFLGLAFGANDRIS
ncbi:DNA glycosylase [Artemisia annua]|uniref:DNA glycosylase n=1 Tax=Artemisia annua TaxID=35608 RepID=A0A2U1NKF9_ARTAN|nr:DNA glycosylase [Artemisia annua]